MWEQIVHLVYLYDLKEKSESEHWTASEEKSYLS